MASSIERAAEGRAADEGVRFVPSMSGATFSCASNDGLLKSLVGETVLYVPNPGNAGDAAIACATVQAFERVGCRYRFASVRCSPLVTRGQIVVYGGGGNFVPYYKHARTFISKHHRFARRLVILPHTVRGHADVLRSLGSNVEIYCRDEESLRHVREVAPAVVSQFAHDMAIGLDVPSVMSGEGSSSLRRFWPPWMMKNCIRPVVGRCVHGWTNRRRPDVLNAFRTDIESRVAGLPPGNLDVSRVFPNGMATAAEATDATRFMLRFLGDFRVVNTDRLHVAILSALLGKEVHLYDNSYGKNSAVFRASLAARFPAMVFHSNSEILGDA